MAEGIRDSREEELERIRQLEASPEYQEKIRILREKMKINIRWKMYKIALVIGIVLLFAMFKFVGIVIAAVLGFIFVYPVYKRKRELFREKKENNEVLYVEKFLSPIVKEIFPMGEMKVTPDFLLDPVKKVCPSSSNYRGNTELCFHDNRELSVMQFPNSFAGHIRIIPTEKTAILKREVQNYPGKQKNELKIDTEDIRHNEHYNIFCTDEFMARRFLNPTVLDWFDKNISESRTAIYIEDSTMYISRYTGYQHFPVPGTVDAIDKLSMAEEYKKLRAEIDFIESFTEIFKAC